MATQPKIEPLEWPAELERGARLNTSGFIPIDKRILVLPDSAEKVTSGGIIVPDAAVEKEEYAKVEATMIAVGETAWGEAIAEARRYGLDFKPPAPGDRIIIAKYGGTRIKGKDGTFYRIMNDEDVIARLED